MRYVIVLLMTLCLSGCCSCVPPGTPPPRDTEIVTYNVEPKQTYTVEEVINDAFSKIVMDWVVTQPDPKPVVGVMLDSGDHNMIAFNLLSKLRQSGLLPWGSDAAYILSVKEKRYRVGDQLDERYQVQLVLTSKAGTQVWSSSEYALK